MRKLKVDPSSAIPLYVQVRQAIRSQITSGDLKPGDMLPGEVALGEQLGISRLTVHRAMRELVGDGLLVRQRSRGTFVAVPRRDKVLVEGPLFSLTEELTRDGLEFSNRILAQEVVAASERSGQRFRLERPAPRSCDCSACAPSGASRSPWRKCTTPSTASRPWRPLI